MDASASATALRSETTASTAAKTDGPNEHAHGQVAEAFEPTLTLEGLRQQAELFAQERDWEQHHTPRNLVLALTGEVGELCECFQWKGDRTSVDEWPPSERVHLGEELSDVAIYLIRLADRCGIDLPSAIQDKIIKNARKYPAPSTDESQPAVTTAPPVVEPFDSKFEPTATFEGLRQQLAAFANARNWNEGHTPRNLVLALSGEMGELCECFQWKPDHLAVADWSASEREHLGEELSDVAIYLIRLADQCNMDLSSAIRDKLVKNARKYPAHLVNGSSQKYTAYIQQVELLGASPQ